MNKKAKYQPIENYGVIGDLRTVALVGMNGSIDFLCFPNFDSPTVFTSLLDHEKGGYFCVSPIEKTVKQKQLYLPDTNILVTRFLLPDGIGELTDFMPVAPLFKQNVVIRRIKNIKGTIRYRMECRPRFNYARSAHEAKQHGNDIIFTSRESLHCCLKLRSSHPLSIKQGDGFAEFSLNCGETAEFIFENIHENELEVTCEFKEFIEKAFLKTFKFWKEWSAKSTYNGHWREMVMRSALVLKLLMSHEHGSIIAAPTFSLPELIAGNKNWDYRFSWIRDAAFTVYALMRLGFYSEAENFMRWIERICKDIEKGNPIHPLYGFDGRKTLQETTLKNLEGYMKSAPVRIGNAAHKQLQIDIYGEFMDSLYLYDKYGSPITNDTWETLTTQVEWVIKNWKSKDYGIWESRGRAQEFLQSRFMCWVAVDRAIRLAIKRSFPFPQSWIKARDAIYNNVYKGFWNEKVKAFTQYKNGTEVDASALLMPLIRFISPNDPKWESTLKRIESDLVNDCLVFRYKPEQSKFFGLEENEGAFTMCSFWYIECLSRAGQLTKAQIYFEKLLSYANHLGLFSEQLGPQGEHLGNFPQAFTHLSLISAAFDLNRRLKEKRSSE